MLFTIALGGNALQQRGEPLEADLLKKNSLAAAKVIAELAKEHQVLIVHGNGPQVGLLALQNTAYKEVKPYPFDILGAESQGMIGYVLQQNISNYLSERTVVTLLTQVIVDKEDPAFQNPSKFIGPVYQEAQLEEIKKQNPHWLIKPDGKYYRRVVPSPKPQQIYELEAIQSLLTQNTIVIAGGGGGIPCIQDSSGKLAGVEAVIDKDMTASLLAQRLNADHFIILTDVEAVCEQWGTPEERKINDISVKELESKSFAAGSMQPKITAACQFTKHSKKTAMIGNLTQLKQIINHQAGTRITC